MNEPIKKLYDKAWSETTDHYQTMQKFAELIVRECAEFARLHNLEKADRSHLIHKAMKEHFGVE